MNLKAEAQEILNRIIAIDTEYHTNAIDRIDRVYCIAATDVNGKVFKKWLYNQTDPHLLDEIKDYYNIADPVYLCHAFDKAERRALKFLGIDNTQYHYLCTYHLAKMLQNTFKRKLDKDAAYESESEQIQEGIKKKAEKDNSLSYAGLCKRYKLAMIDTAHKEEMRGLCINNNTEGNEQAIVDYCADDTKFLIPLFKNLFNEYFIALRGSFCPLRPGMFDGLTPMAALNCLIKQMVYINEFGDIADYGIPINMERINKVKVTAPAYREQLKTDFELKYPGVFRLQKKDGLLHENNARILEELQKCINEYHIADYPRSAKTGKLSTSKDVLETYFKGKECFGEEYRQLNKLSRQLNTISKIEDNPFNYIIGSNDNPRLWYASLEPYGTITSRCTPSTKRFIFGWHKSLYGLMNPKPGKWLVELDYGSQETFVQACICKDAVYNDIYQSKDIYLAFANKMKLVPDDDWNTLPKGKLKEKYASVRSRIKGLILGLSYGMGKQKLSDRLGIPIDTAKKYVDMVNSILIKSTTYKRALGDKAASVNAFSLPDGCICKTARQATDNNGTTIINYPFQSSGAVILRVLIDKLSGMIRNNELKIKLVATIHDAIFFEVDENDMDTINKVSDVMRDIANKVLQSPKTWSIKVGSPDIIKYGEVWTPEGKFNKQFTDLENYIVPETSANSTCKTKEVS